jgi:cytochrome c oxidase cbb3-type subunit III
MPTKIEKDVITGTATTGHEWDGVKELNTPLPKWWVYAYLACIAWAAGYCLLYPSIPYGPGYLHGLLGYSSRDRVDQEVATVVAARGESMQKIGAESFDAILADPKLLQVAQTAGRITFANNCQPCHGGGGAGRIGYPALAAGAWIWGGKLEDIQTTVTHGIRSADPEARQSQMPRFGADRILTAAQIQQVADYVWTQFYGHADPKVNTADGAKIFADNCVACHNSAGEGNRDVGAPRLSSRVHLYGDSRDAIVSQVTTPRGGVMPNWGPRLDAPTLKSVVLYVHSLGGGE